MPGISDAGMLIRISCLPAGTSSARTLIIDHATQSIAHASTNTDRNTDSISSNTD